MFSVDTYIRFVVECQEYSKAISGIVQAIPLVTHTEVVSVNVPKCDYNGVALIVGGKPASAGEFPVMVNDY